MEKKKSKEEVIGVWFSYSGIGVTGKLCLTGLRSTRMRCEKLLETYWGNPKCKTVICQRKVQLQTTILARDFREGLRRMEENGILLEEITAIGVIFQR